MAKFRSRVYRRGKHNTEKRAAVILVLMVAYVIWAKREAPDSVWRAKR